MPGSQSSLLRRRVTAGGARKGEDFRPDQWRKFQSYAGFHGILKGERQAKQGHTSVSTGPVTFSIQRFVEAHAPRERSLLAGMVASAFALEPS